MNYWESYKKDLEEYLYREISFYKGHGLSFESTKILILNPSLGELFKQTIKEYELLAH